MRITIVANKWWESEAMIAAMLNAASYSPLVSADKPNFFPWCDAGSLASPRDRNTEAFNPISRARFSYKFGAKLFFTAELWCISDLLEAGASGSSSSSKATQLKLKLFKPNDVPPDLVIAVGTAGTAIELPNRSGGVAMGAQVFLHNAHLPNTQDANPASNWSDPRQETLILPSIDKLFFEQLAAFDSASALLHFLPVRQHPSISPIITVGLTDVALGTLNVTDYNEYKFKDRETVATYLSGRHDAMPVSVETTHGLIRLASDPAPFVFVTGITDAFLHFDAQVGTVAADGQNFAAAYNTGIAVRYMFAALMLKKLGA